MSSEGTQPELAQTVSNEQPGASRQNIAADANQSNEDSTAALTEDQILALLERRDLAPETLERLTQNSAATKSRKVCVALASHPKAPRHLALRLIRNFYTFDLVQFALRPSVAADLKRIADEQIVVRLASITLGERLTLARSASSTVAAALLLDKEPRVCATALDNERLTEAAIIKALMRPIAPATVEAVCHHSKWSPRREIRVALLRNPHTPLARALEFARTLPAPLLRDVLHTSRLPEKIKSYLRDNINQKK